MIIFLLINIPRLSSSPSLPPLFVLSFSLSLAFCLVSRVSAPSCFGVFAFLSLCLFAFWLCLLLVLFGDRSLLLHDRKKVRQNGACADLLPHAHRVRPPFALTAIAGRIDVGEDLVLKKLDHLLETL